MADPRLTIKKLSGSNGGLIIDKAYAHLWKAALNSPGSDESFSGLVEGATEIKEDQDLGLYYSIDNLIPGFYIQPIKYIPYDVYTPFWCHVYGRGFLLKIIPDITGTEFTLSSDSGFYLEKGENCHLGWSYISFDAFNGATTYSLDNNNASNIKNFHSSLKTSLFQGKKIDLTTLSDGSSKVYLIKAGYFYYLKLTPWPEETGGKSGRICELIINVLDSKNMTSSIRIGADSSTTSSNSNLSISRHDDTTLRIWPQEQDNVMKIEVFELPFKINNMIFSGRREYATNTSSAPSKRGTELVWTFDELKKSNFHITSYDLTLKGSYSVAATGNGFTIISGDKGILQNPDTLTNLKNNTDFTLKTIETILTQGFPVYRSDTLTTKLIANNSGEVSLNVGSSYYDFSTATLTIHGYYTTTPESYY